MVQCTRGGKLVVTTWLINSLTYLLLRRHCGSADNATSQHHRVSEQAVLGSRPRCRASLLPQDSTASTNTTGHFPLIWHERKRLKMSALTLAACWNQSAEPSCVYNAKVKGKSRNSLFPRPTSPLPHTDTLPGPKERPRSNESESFFMSTQLALGWQWLNTKCYIAQLQG